MVNICTKCFGYLSKCLHFKKKFTTVMERKINLYQQINRTNGHILPQTIEKENKNKKQKTRKTTNKKLTNKNKISPQH